MALSPLPRCRSARWSRSKPGCTRAISRRIQVVFGVIVVLVVILVVIPVGVLLSGGVVAGVIGWLLKDNGERTHEGSELIDTNV